MPSSPPARLRDTDERLQLPRRGAPIQGIPGQSHSLAQVPRLSRDPERGTRIDQYEIATRSRLPRKNGSSNGSVHPDVASREIPERRTRHAEVARVQLVGANSPFIQLR